MKIFKQVETWIIIFICVLTNVLIKSIIGSLELPVWFDCIGTVIAGMTLGPVGGAVCGIISNLLNSIGDYKTFFYMPVAAAVGIGIGVFYPIKRNTRSFHIVSLGVFTGFLSALISTPLNIFLYDGRTGNAWGDALMDMLSQNIRIPVINSFVGEAFIDVPDKIYSVFIGVFILWLIKTISGRSKKISAGMIIIALSLSLLPSGKVQAVDVAAELAGDVYDTEDGLTSVEVNNLAQTLDGYIWAGAYSGIYRYDGYKFRSMDFDDRIRNVVDLFVDSSGKLWISTNDSGVACYDPVTEDYILYSKDDGLPSNVIRCVAENSQGEIYIATIKELCYLDTEGELHTILESSLCDISKLFSSGDNMAAVGHDGSLMVIENHRLKYFLAGDYTALAPEENGDFIVGTSGNQTGKLRLSDGGTEIINKYFSDNVRYCNDICYSDEYDGYFMACENGLGFMSNQGVYTDLTDYYFDSSISDCLIDYQGNIWFSSSKQGVKRFTYNAFEDIYLKSGIDRNVANAVMVEDGLLYVASSAGLKTIDLKTYYSVPIPYPAYLNNVRIRDVLCDTKGNFWFCTYGENGLVEITSNGVIRIYNKNMRGIVGERFRLCEELSGGTIVASTNEGLNFIKNGILIHTISSRDGLYAEVLSVVEDEEGRIYAGTDGAGIYIIENGKIVDCIDEQDGLNALVVLKIVPCNKGYLLVTSNSLYYYTSKGVRKLNNFPYSNNYDIYLSDDGKAFVLSSAGIFVVDKDVLLNDEEGYNYTLLNRSRGLYSSITANSKYCVYKDKLYICCTDGVRRIAINDLNAYDIDFKIAVSSITVGDKRIKAVDGVYTIPPSSERIQFDIAILNYTISNPLLHIYLEGADDEGIICYQNELESLVFTNLKYGDYYLHVEVLDPLGQDVERDESFHVVKESQLFERDYFKVYLYLVAILFFLYIGWATSSIIQNANSLEKWQKEATRDPLTGLLNKRGAFNILTEACKNESGTLMILDLDSFKPVNDIYGHDVGDRILISMAQIMKFCTREEDILGRIGGDEFVMFLKNALSDEVVQEKTEFLNSEILREARNYLGKDMNIPIGVSVGAVRVPNEGTDYQSLFKKADKALYRVKNGGKHGFSIYVSGGAAANVGANNTGGLSELIKIIKERDKPTEAYRFDYNSLSDIYRFIKRVNVGEDNHADILLFELKTDDNKPITAEITDIFYETIKAGLGTRDLYCNDGKTRVIVITNILPGDKDETVDEKITNAFENNENTKGFRITCEKAKT